MRTILLFLLASIPCFAQCSGAYCSAAAQQATPATAAISASNPVGISNTSFQITTRWTNGTYSGGANWDLFNLGGFRLTYIAGGMYLQGPDTGMGGTCTVALTSAESDVQFRIQRNVSTMRAYLQIWNTLTRNQVGSTCTFTLTALGSAATIKATGVTIGHASGTGQLAYVRWSTTLDSLTTAPSLGESTAANLGDWEFGPTLGSSEAPGSPNDISGYAQNLSGSLVYSNTATYSPSCATYAGPSARASTGTVTFAPACAPLDGGTTLTYAWSNASCADGTVQTPSPSTATTATWSPTGLVRGCMNAALTVTDGTAQSASYTFHAGLVSTDTNGIVDYSWLTGYSVISKLLGSQCRYSDTSCATSTWPHLDDRHRAAVDAQIPNLSNSCQWAPNCYGPFWQTFDSGTITVTGGSTTITGSGTTFTTAVATGTTPKSGAVIVFRYTGTDSRTHYTIRLITAIASNTSLTSAVYPLTGDRWGALPNCNAGCSGLSYSIHWDGSPTGYGAWSYGGAPANYYDNVVAFYTLWLRTGIDTYLTAARTLAANFWESPQMDQGTSCDAFLSVPAVYSACFPGRSRSMLGLMIYMLENGYQSTMLPGLRIIWTGERYLGNTYWPGRGFMEDLREEGYNLATLSYCALVETDATYAFSFPNTGTDATQAADCRTVVVNQISSLWGPFQTGPGWYSFNAYPGAGTTSVVFGNWSGAGTVAVTNGSTVITGTGTAFDCAQINTTWGGYALFYTWRLAGGTTAAQVPTYANLITGGYGDTTYYKVTCSSSTGLTIIGGPTGSATNYLGTTSTGNGFALAPSPDSGLSNTNVGWGAQVYPQGIANFAFEVAALALDGHDNTSRDVYLGYSATGEAWIENYGHDTTTGKKGMYTAVDTACGHPVPATDLMCGWPLGTPDQTRQLSAESIRGRAMLYARTADATVKTFGDSIITEMWCSPTGGGSCTPDGYYLNEYNDDGSWLNGSPPAGTAAKWTGQAFGIGSSESWLAVGFSATSTPSRKNTGRVKTTGKAK